MSVVVLKFRGSGETLRRGMDTVAQAIAALGGSAQVVTRTLNGRKSHTPISAPAETIDSETVEDVDSETSDIGEQETGPSTAPAAPKTPARPRKLPKFDSKLVVTPFKAFAAERNPQTVDEKYLVACLWLQENSGLASYGPSQIFTCFRAMEWQTYDDFTQPVRQLKQKKSYFADTDKRGEWKLNDHGLDEARKIKHSATT